MNKKLFVIGIGGLTGSKLAELAKNEYDVFGSYNFRNPQFGFGEQYQLDLLDFKKLNEIINEIEPDIIINASAINNVDYCESHKEHAKKINVDVLNELKTITKNNKIKLVHLSTDSVFDGTKTEAYVETDIPNPINYYGKTKLLGEKIVMIDSKNLIIRASVLYGKLLDNLTTSESSSMKSLNFSQWLIEKLRNEQEVKIITDEFSSPIIADDLAKSILHLIKYDKNGIFHSAPKIKINRFEFSQKIAKFFDFNSKLIVPVTNKDLGRNVKTAANKCLDSSKIIRETNFEFLSLDDSLKMLHNQYK